MLGEGTDPRKVHKRAAIPTATGRETVGPLYKRRSTRCIRQEHDGSELQRRRRKEGRTPPHDSEAFFGHTDTRDRRKDISGSGK